MISQNFKIIHSSQKISHYTAETRIFWPVFWDLFFFGYGHHQKKSLATTSELVDALPCNLKVTNVIRHQLQLTE